MNAPAPIQPETAKPVPFWERKIVWISLAVIILLGAGTYFFVYQQTSSPPILQGDTTGDALQSTTIKVDVAAQGSVNYIYLLRNNETKLLGTVPAREQSSVLLVSQFPDDTDNLYFVRRSGNSSTDSLIRITSDGKQTEILTFTTSIPGDTDIIALSPDRARIAYCGGGGPEVTNISDQTNTKYQAQNFCTIGSGSLWFSRDGSKLYSQKGFYEGPYGDYTQEELRQMQIKAHNGLYELDLATKLEKYLGLDVVSLTDIVKDIYLENEYKTLTVKNVAGITKDILTQNEYAKLPTIVTISIPGEKILDAKLTADGMGIYYLAYPDPTPNPSGDFKIGYYDIAQKKDHYPIITSRQQPTLIAPLDNKNLYYLVETDPSSQTSEKQLVKLSLDGTRTVIDSNLRSGELPGGYLLFVAP